MKTKAFEYLHRVHIAEIWPGAWSCIFSFWASLAASVSWEQLGCRYRGDNCDKLYFTLDTPLRVCPYTCHPATVNCTQIRISRNVLSICPINNKQMVLIYNRKALIKQKHHAELTQFVLRLMDTCEMWCGHRGPVSSLSSLISRALALDKWRCADLTKHRPHSDVVMLVDKVKLNKNIYFDLINLFNMNI